MDEIGVGEVAWGKWEHNGKVNRVIYSYKATLLTTNEWRIMIAFIRTLTFEEILFLMEWRQALFVRVLGKLIGIHKEVDRARNKNSHIKNR